VARHSKPTVTVGIAAYNEQANIGYLLQQLLNEDQDDFILERIVVVSDGSTDATCEAVKRIGNPRIELICERQRTGRARRHEQLLRMCHSDVFVSLDADIVLSNSQVLGELVRPIVDSKADLVSCRLEATTPTSVLQKALWFGLRLRNRVAESHRGGDNVYTCHGTARTFSRRMYESYMFADGVAEDAYSYLYAKWRGYIYRFLPDTSVATQLPSALRDYWRQSARFQQNRAEMRRYFTAKIVREQFRLPTQLSISSLWAELNEAPIWTLSYLALAGLCGLIAPKRAAPSNAWQVATSTKRPPKWDDGSSAALSQPSPAKKSG
jgi:glycosyltransferase involved in cell wall biosynthesis